MAYMSKLFSDHAHYVSINVMTSICGVIGIVFANHIILNVIFVNTMTVVIPFPNPNVHIITNTVITAIINIVSLSQVSLT